MASKAKNTFIPSITTWEHEGGFSIWFLFDGKHEVIVEGHGDSALNDIFEVNDMRGELVAIPAVVEKVREHFENSPAIQEHFRKKNGVQIFG